ncbi:endonuclease/exonuclease/phosphatase family protein [Nocardia sp. NPDC059239]|uniref:endonuclease/exonuclease/phosphatase family protein n=1 Tax=Nocardia sp. NPDC059239 TaxID=3346785 RepID=UPI0036BC97CD
MDTPATQPAQPEHVRVVSWNLWSKYGDWRQRRESIIATLSGLGADLIGLQEVWSDQDGNLATYLADRLGMQYLWQPALPTAAGQTQIGNAILSRWPILEQAELQLPTPPDRDEGRKVLHALINGPAGTIPFFTTHLNAPFHQSAIRTRQAAALTNFVAARSHGHLFPPIITGDFNAEPDSDEIRLLLGKTSAPDMVETCFFDAWSFLDPTVPGWTWDRANPLVGTRGQPNTRIDYIFVGTSPTDIHHTAPASRGHVQSAFLAGNRADADGTWASDHAAVVADFSAHDTAPAAMSL